MIVTVGLLPLVSTTVEAADYDYPYITCLTDASGNSTVYLSQEPIHVYTSRSTSSYDAPYFYYIAAYTESPVIELVYGTSINQWQTNVIHTPGEEDETYYRFGESTRYTGKFVFLVGGLYTTDTYQKYHIITNTSYTSAQQGYFLSYSNDVDTLPQGLTESAVRDIINDQINTQTSTGQTAQTIINNTTQQYNLYLSGNIDSASMLENVANNLDTLSNLTPNTILDAMQVNNALTYNQSIQDQILNNASTKVTQMFDQYIRMGASYTYYQYQQGLITQSQANQAFTNYLRSLSNEITSGEITSTADIEAVNAMVNMIQSYLNMIHNERDLSAESSDKSQASDREELEYLDALEAETTTTIEQLSPKNTYTASELSDTSSILDMIWEIDILKKVVVVAACFMVISVALGVRYKI